MNERLSTTIDSNLSSQDARTVLNLRLLVARAANKDSLAWWDDESLTPHAGFLLERLFPMAPPLAARSLALNAALARHDAACGVIRNALHLYRLDADSQDRLALRFEALLPIPVPVEPIPSTEGLKQCLLVLLGAPAAYTVVHRTGAGGLQIEIPPVPRGVSPLLHRARTLAWAYLEGAPGQPAIPYFVE
ncbi:MAG: BrxE family protein [Chloroflexota bacterium]